MRATTLLATLLLAIAVPTLNAADAPAPKAPPATASKQLDALLQTRISLYGHRNWIAIVDSAYPAQTAPGIETIAIGGDQIEAVQKVIAALKTARHVRPTIYLDRELATVPEKYAPGVTAYRDTLKKLLASTSPQTLLHEKIIYKLDEASRTFRVLILKTDAVLPYTSVFIELECGYWSAEAENALRTNMGK